MNRLKLYLGIFILVFIGVSKFISFEIEEGINYKVKDNLLGVVIFHNPFVLGIYLLIGISLIIDGSNVMNKKIKKRGS